jgi:hypothetical protein
MDAVPEAVKKLMCKHMPNFKAEKVEKSTRSNFEIYFEIYYESERRWPGARRRGSL